MGINDVTRFEVSGPAGGPIEVAERLTVGEQMMESSSQELAGLLRAAARTAAAIGTGEDEDDDDILDAEIVEDEGGGEA